MPKGITFKINRDCWECTSHKINSDGYPRRHSGNVSRFIYQSMIGEIPKNYQVCHICDNRLCINPKHLFLGTMQENQADKIRKNRQARNKGEGNGRAKLTLNDVLKIRNDSRFITEICKDYGVCNQLISRIKRNEIWKNYAMA